MQTFYEHSLLQKTYGGCFWKNPRDFCGSSGKGIFWSFSIGLLWFSNIMLNLLTKSFFDISLLFKLKYAAVSLTLWTVNKPCYNDSLCLQEYTKNTCLKKKSTFIRSKKVQMIFTFQRNRHFSKISVSKTFTYVQEQEKSDVAATFQLHSG